MTANVYAAV